MNNTSFLHKINLFTRSFIFSVIMALSIILQSFLCVLAWPLPLRWRYGMVIMFVTYIIWLLKVLCNVDYKLEGAENIPHDRAGVILSKHQSTWETFFLPIIFRQPAIILKRELLWLPFFGWGLASISPIAINRSHGSSAMQQIIAKGKKCLEEGRWILVFPEGTRIPVGKVGNYKLGGARLAVATGAPVVPVAHNAGKFWSKRKFIKQPGTVRIIIGPVIETVNRTPEEVMDEAKNWIEETVKKIN
jgi:1-acyl-sn-glycerol-3-phosphate acyltransferase